jgi:hypothetical protein
MLGERDLFSDVNPKHSSLYQLCERRSSSLDCEDGHLSGDAVRHPCQSGRNNLDVTNIKLMSHQHTFVVSSVLSKDHVINNNGNTNTIDQHERLTRRWCLTVIVLLYVGLVTSFCLNISLLLKTNPQHSSTTHTAREVYPLYEGN